MKSNIVGIVALSIWVVVEGFFPDLQAEIKTKYKPQPSEMMEVINKWATIAVFVVMVVSWNFLEFCLFMVTHPFFTLELFVSAFFAAFGQFFVYRMIKHFKQHVLPFTITTRKLFTVWLSIIFFDHQTNWMQSLGIIIVMATVAFDFSIEVSKPVKLPV
jgi:UDP-galactose transporter B1